MADLPEGIFVISDSYEMYLHWTTPEDHDVLIVTKKSSVLHSILPLVDNQQHIESIVDPGSQIIVMSDGSANGEIDELLGLAHNVPFLISDIMLYLQNFTNEQQLITIHDLNTGRKAVLPTILRGALDFATQGFDPKSRRSRLLYPTLFFALSI
ncbi:hypothetical protein EW146_g3319 [Bondarzewia mesenterica]|uniref:Uncharacterized protein n=1 Tax=Bondarzewia mesenterica TaxID=1095465 RepID=A0A4S4M3U4_9AGAM|nr:hypothetical protein EW146_g3319 [Bondarzewia mesenterica]